MRALCLPPAFLERSSLLPRAGAAAVFRITARDSFGNVKTAADDMFLATLSTELATSQGALSASPLAAMEHAHTRVEAEVSAARDSNGSAYYAAHFSVTVAGYWRIAVS